MRRGTKLLLLALVVPALGALVWAVAIPRGAEAAARYVPPRMPAHPEVWAVGDAGVETDGARAVADRIARGRPDLFLYLGDVYPDGREEDFRLRYHPLYGRLARRTAPTPGNHEWDTAGEGYFPYWRARLGRRLPAYYAFRAGGWKILSLNSNLDGDGMERQRRWLVRNLRGGGNCRIAFWHEPRYSGGAHGDDPGVDPLWRPLRRRARLVLNGHDHDMQVLKPPRRPRILVSGAGGKTRYAIRGHPFITWWNDDDFGALRMRLRRGALRYAFVSAEGSVLHRDSLRCRP